MNEFDFPPPSLQAYLLAPVSGLEGVLAGKASLVADFFSNVKKKAIVCSGRRAICRANLPEPGGSLRATSVGCTPSTFMAHYQGPALCWLISSGGPAYLPCWVTGKLMQGASETMVGNVEPANGGSSMKISKRVPDLPDCSFNNTIDCFSAITSIKL